MITFIGDVHGKFSQYVETCYQHGKTIQVGDYGLGFSQKVDESMLKWGKDFPKNRFIRGNHDNPAVCQKAQNYIEDGHYDEKLDMFFVGGAYSIDKKLRTEGINWWKDEEVPLEKWEDITNKYRETKPSIMVTHDCPQSVVYYVKPEAFSDVPSLTRNRLEELLGYHKPELWVFGHWHTSFDMEIHGTRFVCLNEMETMTI